MALFVVADLEESEIMEAEESTSKKHAYFPHEILSNLEYLKFGPKIERESDYFYPVTFRGKTCHIQTPKCLYMFGLNKYRNPGGKFDKYSIHLSLREICREAPNNNNVTNFRNLLENIDLFAQQDNFEDPKWKYWSALRPNHKSDRKPPTLRIKVPSDAKRLKITIVKEDGKECYYPLASEFEEMFKHRNEVRCIIEVNPIWYAGSKFGISYKLIKIQLAEAGRRDIQFR